MRHQFKKCNSLKEKSRFHETKIFRHSSIIDFEHKVYCTYVMQFETLHTSRATYFILIQKIRSYYGRRMTLRWADLTNFFGTPPQNLLIVILINVCYKQILI